MTPAQWSALCDKVADIMKVHTRPFVPILGGAEVGTGTFVDRGGPSVLTCAHVAKFDPHAHYVDDSGSTERRPGAWRIDPSVSVDAALAPIDAGEWGKVSGSAAVAIDVEIRKEPFASAG